MKEERYVGNMDANLQIPIFHGNTMKRIIDILQYIIQKVGRRTLYKGTEGAHFAARRIDGYNGKASKVASLCDERGVDAPRGRRETGKHLR